MRLIDAECLCDLVEQSSILSAGFKQVFEKIVAGEPTVDAVPVVRCRDCKYLYTDEYGFLACAESGAMLGPEDDDYCSRGQRRDQFAGGGKTGGQNDAEEGGFL